MFTFIQKVFVAAISFFFFFFFFFFGNALKCVSMNKNDQACKVRLEIININSNGFWFILIVLE